MLRSLAITDFTIIDRLELDFGPGFGAITGETGAGKSILIDALGLLLGDRADAAVVAAGARRADLSARFELPDGHPALDWLVEQALDEDGEVLIRRMVPADGASRAWINGQSATVGQLRELGQRLVEIHGQHEHQRLADPHHQRAWLDRGVDAAVRGAVADAAAHHRKARTALADLDAEAGTDAELLRFQLEELDALDLGDDELPALEAEQRRLASVDDLQRACGQARDALEGDGEDGALTGAVRAIRSLEPLADREPGFGEVLEMLGTARVNLEESVRALSRMHDDLEADPERLDAVDRRLGRAMELARKHRTEPEALPELRRQLRARLERIDGAAEAREAAERALAQARSAWLAAARALHDDRRKVAATLIEAVGEALAALGMDTARLEFELAFDEDAEVSRHGADAVEILFSANPGQPPRSLKRVASGGELSRLSLAMIIAAAEPAAGLVRIFDEIDAGVGGETAHKVGEFLHRAGEGGQAFCVTHLAQVAARADRQFRVLKRAEDGRTRVTVESLDRDARIAELARMLGSTTGRTSRRHAEALLAGNAD
ncbi:DNA repair protein RecN [Wenzhouxiangella sp. XN79A]|uniref:DNA repair protein RecN n=1 Tax=Wenzhouxiangella sp. XN79A TaxID=2724193 RepID=UPI00144A570D|nr:DNA repair protein RecN [Wenzhouxiangella sp. XN79A]NKI34814.1 DNA repair protein RecN [Wenzhouxiangella sp. XN79A]